MIRPATINDLERLTEIYNQAIATKKATADLLPLTAEQRKPWFSQFDNPKTPIFVYEENGTVAGYCYLSSYRPGRQALESIAEISYYVDFAHHQKGIGSKLLEHTIGKAKELGYKNLLAILLSCNSSSIALLKKYGFTPWGTLPDIVYIGDAVYSHYYYGLKLFS